MVLPTSSAPDTKEEAAMANSTFSLLHSASLSWKNSADSYWFYLILSSTGSLKEVCLFVKIQTNKKQTKLLLVLIEKQSIVVNGYVNLSCLEVLLPTLIPPSSQELPSCCAGEAHGLLTSGRRDKVSYFQRSGQPLNVQILFLLISPPNSRSFPSRLATGAHRDLCCMESAGFSTWQLSLSTGLLF